MYCHNCMDELKGWKKTNSICTLMKLHVVHFSTMDLLLVQALLIVLKISYVFVKYYHVLFRYAHRHMRGFKPY